MDPKLIPLLVVFLGIFHVIGGAAFGTGLRRMIWEGGEAEFLLIWGGLFGGIPMVFDLFLLFGNPFAGVIGPALFLASMLITTFFWRGVLEEIGAATLTSIVVGAGALLLGAAALPFLVERGEVVFAILWSSIFITAGAIFLFAGLNALRRGRAPRTSRSRGRADIDTRNPAPLHKPPKAGSKKHKKA